MRDASIRQASYNGEATLVEVLVWKDYDGSRVSAGMHRFEMLPQIGHSVDIIEPAIEGKVIKIIHSSSKTRQQTEIVVVPDIDA